VTLAKRKVEYKHGTVVLQGVAVWDDAASGKRPGVLVAHQWAGRDEFAESQAEALAQLGYTAFALDMYGKGVLGNSVAENSALMTPFMQDRRMLADRMNAALDTLRSLETVDSNRLAAIGFCFGGLCVLDLARSGADVAGVVSFHGLLKPAPAISGKPVQAKILVLHGSDDPLAPIEDVVALREEFIAAGADWQLHMYGGAKHAFAVPGADIPDIGALYNRLAERRSQETKRSFLRELFDA
jgi:dienelactone hydrolase